MRIGYVGLGAMGGALAERLLTSFPLSVHDLGDAARDRLRALGAEVAPSASALAAGCDVVITCLPRSADVHEALFGPDGMANAMRPGTILIDQTSGDPAETRRIAAELATRGVVTIDAPVSGGPAAAAAGTVAIMVGGADEDVDRIAPILAAISPNVFRCGALGSGQIMKLVNNVVTMGARFATLEAAALGIRNGSDLAVITDVLNAGGARTRTSENMLPALVRGERHARFAMALMLKDVNLATSLAMESGVPLAFGQLTRAALQTSINEEGADANLDDIVNTIGRQAGVNLRAGSAAGKEKSA